MSTLNTSPHGNSFPRRGEEEEEEEEREYAENCTGADTDDLYYVGRTPFRTGVLYIIYISIRFFSFFSPPFFPPPSFRSTPPPPFSRIQLPPPVYYTHTYAHTKRMLMRASRNTRIGVTAQLIKTQRFSRDHLDRSILLPLLRIGFQRLPPICTFPAPPTIIDDDNNNIIQSLARRIPRIRMEMSASKKS